MIEPRALPSIRLTDIRDGGTERYAIEASDRARALRDDCLAIMPKLLRPAIPLLDGLARRWLMRSQSPYLHEITRIAAALGFPGVWLLNGSYQWGCTAIAREENDLPWLARTLDWPFRGLGRHVEVAHKRGPAGEFFSVTWPGYIGTLTAMAPRRFAASINQAPLWRRTNHPLLRPYDMAANALNTWRLSHIPPDQLLRLVFENCESFDEARRKLETTPIARPVIYVLVGTKNGERCVIERTEESFRTRMRDTVAANDWQEGEARWEARIGGMNILLLRREEAARRSRARQLSLAGFAGSFEGDSFAWIVPPVLNPCTRIGVEMCAASGEMRVVGYDVVEGHELPQQVTQVWTISDARAAA